MTGFPSKLAPKSPDQLLETSEFGKYIDLADRAAMERLPTAPYT
jgi:hypothetical protein